MLQYSKADMSQMTIAMDKKVVPGGEMLGNSRLPIGGRFVRARVMRSGMAAGDGAGAGCVGWCRTVGEATTWGGWSVSRRRERTY